jgi:hypothetical protein
VTSKDTLNNTYNVLANVTVNLTKSGSGAFYSDVGCTAPITSTTIASGTSASTFYFSDSIAETQTLTVADNNAAYLAGSTLAVSTGTRLLALTGPTPSRAGDCNLLTITSKDDQGFIMSLEHKNYDIKGVQYHPESVLTPLGATIIANWLKK